MTDLLEDSDSVSWVFPRFVIVSWIETFACRETPVCDQCLITFRL